MTVLVLAGTSDARSLLAQVAGAPVVASLAGVTTSPRDLGVPTRRGGFGGAAGLHAYLKQQAIKAVLDMTHPYAAQMPSRAAAVCKSLSIPYLRYLRRPWVPQATDSWTDVTDAKSIADALPPQATLFLALGGLSMEGLEPLYGHALWLRRLEAGRAAPWPKGGIVTGAPSADPDVERALMDRLGITHMVAKNSGGPLGYGKLLAARALGLPVFLFQRPAPPDAPRTERLEIARDWVLSHGW